MSGEQKFDCNACPAFCCTGAYTVTLQGADAARLSLRLGLLPKELRRQYTTDGKTLAHKADPLFDRACVFLDTQARRCTVYASRPEVCRTWPKPEHAAPGAEGRCAYYDLTQYVRREAGDAERLPFVQIVRVVDEGRESKKRRAAG